MKNQLLKLSGIILFIFSITSCENEPIGQGLDIDLSAQTIKNGSELFVLLQTLTGQGDNPVQNTVCIDFIYPCKIFVYDSDAVMTQEITVTGDAQFSAILAQLPLTHSISLSYPLQTNLPDGTVFRVNTNAELKIALDSCSREDIITYCGGLFGSPQGTCVWRVPYIPGENNEYAGAIFTADATNTITLYHHNTTYNGTWIFLFLNDELYLNISLAGNTPTVFAWNYNFKITDATGDLFELQTPTATRKLVKDCSNSNVFAIGQTGPAGGIIAYDKGSYTNGWRYMEVAVTDSAVEEWGCLNGQIIASKYDQIGTGYQNTVAIANYHNNLTNYYLNPGICSSLNNGSLSAKTALNEISGLKNDWFIPSISELQLLYTNLHLAALGGFMPTNYWSSSEMDTSKAKCLDFNTGQMVNLDKNSASVKTRLIRFF